MCDVCSETSPNNDIPAFAVVLLKLCSNKIGDVAIHFPFEAGLVESLLGRRQSELDFLVGHVLGIYLRLAAHGEAYGANFLFLMSHLPLSHQVQNRKMDYDLDELEAILDGSPVLTKVVNGDQENMKMASEAEMVAAPTEEQREVWRRMVEASGLSAEEQTKDEANLYRVVYSPYVAVRAEPDVKSKLLGGKKKGEIVSVEWAMEAMWVKLRDEPGWMLTHGADLGLPQLLTPCGGAYDDL